MIGTKRDRVFKALTELHGDGAAYRLMAEPVFPYGDGHAALKIVAALQDRMAAPVSRRLQGRAKRRVA